LWYGLKEGNRLIAVKYFRHREPDILDFGVPIGIKAAYVVVVVRIREVGTAVSY